MKIFVVLNKNNDAIAEQGTAAQLQSKGIIQSGQPVSPPKDDSAEVTPTPEVKPDGASQPPAPQPPAPQPPAPQPEVPPLLTLTIDDLANMGITNFSNIFVLEDPTKTYGSVGAIGTFNTDNPALMGKRFKRTVDSTTKEVSFVEVR